jgi:hypothetical protein
VTAESSYLTERMVVLLDRGTPKKIILLRTVDARIYNIGDSFTTEMKLTIA